MTFVFQLNKEEADALQLQTERAKVGRPLPVRLIHREQVDPGRVLDGPAASCAQTLKAMPPALTSARRFDDSKQLFREAPLPFRQRFKPDYKPRCGSSTRSCRTCFSLSPSKSADGGLDIQLLRISPNGGPPFCRQLILLFEDNRIYGTLTAEFRIK